MKHSIIKFIQNLPPVHPAGRWFVVLFFFMALFLDQFSTFFGWVGLILTAWCAYFFRDPERVITKREGAVVSPADGKITAIREVTPPTELNLGSDKLLKVSIFLNVFDVHINRVPVEGKITARHYIPGKFLNAELDKASEKNERMLLTVKRPDGVQIGFVQIAGLVARRIVCWAREGQSFERGERFGLIRFGSRMDVYLPKTADIRVELGQKVMAGETVLADVAEKKKAAKPAAKK